MPNAAARVVHEHADERGHGQSRPDAMRDGIQDFLQTQMSLHC